MWGSFSSTGAHGPPATPSEPRSSQLVSRPGASAASSQERGSRVLAVASSLCVTQTRWLNFSKPQFVRVQNGLQLPRGPCSLETPGPGCLSAGGGSVPSTGLKLSPG